MFDSSLHTALAGDATVQGWVEDYNSRPGVFADLAPEDAKKPFIVFKITKTPANSLAVDQFSVMIDLYERTTSRADMKETAFAIETLLDTKQLTHPRFKVIRFYRFSAGPVPTADPRDIHYNLQFSARADRYGWMQTL